MSDTAIAIRCQGLSRHYGEIVALDELTLEVPAGVIFGFLGRNGAGKTTTIRLLTGLAHPTAGRAWVNDVETTQADSSARTQFGYLPQSPVFYNWMTPVTFLDYVGHLSGLEGERRPERIKEMLALTGLEKAAKRKIGGFSGGMLQRLGLAQALLHQPPVLFLDEPTSALDPAGRYELLALIESLRGQVTVFLSSHILADVERVCDTIGIIHAGKLIALANRDELLAQYASNVLALELTVESMPALSTLQQTLSEQPWVNGITQHNNTLHLTVSDRQTGQAAIFPLLVEQQIMLNKYEWVRPTLEDIFLQLSQ